MNHHQRHDSTGERDQLEQELIELHFGCHEDPARLEARLAADPGLRALQADVLQKARLLERAARPEQAPIALPDPGTAATPSRWRWLRRPAGRLGTMAAAAAATVLGFFVAERLAHVRLAHLECERLHLTVSAPQAVPAGAPWSFTVQANDLRGSPAACRVRWRALGKGDAVLRADEAAVVDGKATVAVPADLQVPDRIEVVASHATDEVRQVFSLSTAAAGPLVHVTTDRPVYRPGEPVFVRAIVLDRVTRLPLPTALRLQAQLLDARGAPVVAGHDLQAAAGVGSFVLQLPADSAGGPHQIRVQSLDGLFPTETADVVVRAFQTPLLKKTIVLDRMSYAPGARGAATVTAERLSIGGGASGARAQAVLLVDGVEVWAEQKALGANGDATFRFTVPTSVEKGAARFVATITDGGIVETEVEPFVVPTGKVLLTAFPEGGELVAGVENNVYFECADPLGRPIDGIGLVFDDHGELVARFRTAHQGRGKVAFVPRQGVGYRARLVGQEASFALPSVQGKGLALRMPDLDVAAGAPLRLSIDGRGDGPWLLGVFCRGVLVGQTTLRADERGELRTVAEVTLPAGAAGVLRATVFDRSLQPVAERLVRRLPAERLDVAITPQRSTVLPGDEQQVTVRTTDEAGKPQRALVGLCVTDLAAVSLGSEPRIGLVDQAMLFADVERMENLGDFFLGAADGPRNVDLLLGTRGWRRFVWRNDTAAQAAIAARGGPAEGTLAREGFSHTPQVVSNLEAARAAAAQLNQSAARASRSLQGAAQIAGVLLLLAGIAEVLAWLLRRTLEAPPLLQVLAGTGAAVAMVFVATLMLPDQLDGRAAASAWGRDFDGTGSVVTLTAGRPPVLFTDFHVRDALKDAEVDVSVSLVRRFAATDEDAAPSYFLSREPTDLPARLPFDLGAGGWDDFIPQGTNGWAVDLRARQYAHQHAPADDRRDFAATVFWSTLVPTDQNGEATVRFATSDAVTTWLVQADAHTPQDKGRLGSGKATFAAQQPLHVEAKLPDEVAAGDQLQIPVAVVAADTTLAEATIRMTVGRGLQLADQAPLRIPLQRGRGRALLCVAVGPEVVDSSISLEASAGRFRDRVQHPLRIAARGFPHRRSQGGSVAAGAPSTVPITVPVDAIPGSGRVTLKVLPSPISALTEGLAGILQEPHGCFEQASSSNYPNTLVLTLLEANGDDVPVVAARARELLPRGYAKITGYECRQRGYEWFGADPGHEALTAYGLLQFHDMAKVYDVDAAMVERTRQWLLARRDGQGNYPHQGQDHHGFGGRSTVLTNAYVTYALLQAGTPASELATEIGALVGRLATKDPYELALISCALQLAGRPEAGLTRDRLGELQAADGSLRGTTTTITQSGGQDLAVETTGFAVLAWLPDAAHAARTRAAIEFLQRCRSASGTFGATQATIVALRALTAYATANRTLRAPGTLRVFAGDEKLAERAFTADEVGALSFELWDRLAPGEHTLRLEVEGGNGPLPWACDVAYHAEQPADDPDATIAVATSLHAATVAEGGTVALDVELTNRAAAILPTPIAIVGLPAGLELPTRVLEDLQQAGAFASWELKGRELILYWRELAPGATQRLTLDLVARVPGQTTGPASRAHPYYTPQQKRWAAPLRIDVTPAK